ncbi:MAG TPA: molybdenum cofactor guanylyltransferase [Acidobacteriaceae bacterium]|nr:molybdenum cofactor guanylyltransferase [Terriglobia bacterium]HVC89970.1 molybdenum cofactor guanylyltransferase [Acidobacteriaceae bacterium]
MKEASEKISGFVLAGGRSTRLGQDKALLPWLSEGNCKKNGQTLLDHAIARLRLICDTVSICADRDDLRRPEPMISDALPDSGPLGGIVAALEQSLTEWNMFLAVDLPLLPVEVFEALVARVQMEEQSARAADPPAQDRLACFLPQLDGLPQPLCGLYHRALAPGLRRALEQGKRKIMIALKESTRDSGTTMEFQPQGCSFRIDLWDAAGFAASTKTWSSLSASDWFLNINTPEELQRAQDLMSA